MDGNWLITRSIIISLDIAYDKSDFIDSISDYESNFYNLFHQTHPTMTSAMSAKAAVKIKIIIELLIMEQ